MVKDAAVLSRKPAGVRWVQCAGERGLEKEGGVRGHSGKPKQGSGGAVSGIFKCCHLSWGWLVCCMQGLWGWGCGADGGGGGGGGCWQVIMKVYENEQSLSTWATGVVLGSLGREAVCALFMEIPHAMRTTQWDNKPLALNMPRTPHPRTNPCDIPSRTRRPAHTANIEPRQYMMFPMITAKSATFAQLKAKHFWK